MIIIEPPLPPTLTAAPLSKRDLQRFLVLAKAAVRVHGVVSVLLTNDDAIRDLNLRFRHKDKATDVLSFPAFDLDVSGSGSVLSRPSKIAGDLAISYDTAARQAKSFGHDITVEIKVLILHGLLHLAGLDHEADSGDMAAREQELRQHLSLPAGLIQRSEVAGVRRSRKPSLQTTASELVEQGVPKSHVSKASHGAPEPVSDLPTRRPLKRRSTTR